MAIELLRAGRLLRIILNRPEKRNALNVETCRQVIAAVSEANNDRSVGAILLTGAGKSFCSGMDLNEAPTVNFDSLAQAHDRLFTLYEWAAKPVIAAVHGAAIAGGTGLVANAHVVIAAEDATFGLTEVRLGLWPVLIFPAIVRAVGERRAMELSLTGRTFHAPEAQAYGLVSEVVAADRLADRALEVANGIADSSATALRSGIEYVNQIRGRSNVDALRTGRVVRDHIMQDPDFQEGVRAFQEKRAPAWPSHRV